MNLDPGLSSSVFNMISLVSRLIYNYHSKPPLPSVDYFPSLFQMRESLFVQAAGMFVMETGFFSYIIWTNSAVRSLEPDIVIDLRLGQRTLLTKLSQISFLLKQMTRDSWGASRRERNTCLGGHSCNRECVTWGDASPPRLTESPGDLLKYPMPRSHLSWMKSESLGVEVGILSLKEKKIFLNPRCF